MRHTNNLSFGTKNIPAFTIELMPLYTSL